ncbi:MAG: hypothetical protein J6U26_05125 [Lachnospiraceae bacterium]|nr:hypothetical protein [Lachnospiraceae bacterium]
MKKDVVISFKGTQRYPGQDPHTLELVTDGVMTTGRSYRGRTTRMIDEYVRDLMPALENAVPSRVFVNSAACDEEIVRAVREKIESMHRFREVLVTTAGGVICSHCGPGTFSITYVAPEN